MANLTSLREKIKNTIDYSPELQQFNDQLDQLLNDAYYYLWTFKRWNFATKTAIFPFYVDMLPTRDIENTIPPTAVVAANVVRGDRRVIFSVNMDRLTYFGTTVWEGQPISIQNYEYTISKVIDGSTILLDRLFQGTTNATDDTWIIKKRIYDLPEDSLELLYLGHRDFPYNISSGSFPPFGKATAILARRDEELDLRADFKSSYAEAYIWSPAYQVPSAERLALTQAARAGTGGITPGTYWELCWAFQRDGKIGALSEPQVIKLSPQNNTITMSFIGWDDVAILSTGYHLTDDFAPPWEGCRKLVYWNKNFDKISGERKGLPCWVALQGGGSIRGTPTFSDPIVVDDLVSTYTINYLNQFENGSKKYIEVDGQHNRIRPYPRVDAWDFEQSQIKDEEFQVDKPHDFIKEGIIRYYKKPQDMVLGTDSPELPFEFHHLIVYKALEDIYQKLGQQTLAATYRLRIEKDIKDLQKRYLDHIDSQIIRGQFGMNSRGTFYDQTTLRQKA